MRALIFGAVIVVAGCQCFSPVDEDAGVLTDAGRTGGGATGGGSTGGGATGGGSATGGGGATGGGATGGGATGGGGQLDGGCVTHTDCPGTPPQVSNQCISTMGAWSCAFGNCVAECSNGRTCTSPDAGCLDCGTGLQCVRPANCPMVTSIQLESSTCNLPMVTLMAQSLSSQPCTYLVSWPDGGVLGTISYFGADDLSANIPSLGGGCVGTQLPTGALRHNVSCPDCMMVVMP